MEGRLHDRPGYVDPSVVLWLFVFVAVFGAFAGAALAQTRWTDGNGSWFNAANWSAGVPNGTLAGQVNNGGTSQIFADSAQAANVILGNNPGESGSLSIFSLGGIPGELAAAAFLVVGNGGNGQLNISGKGSATSTLGVIGGSGGIGTATVTGADASWSNTSLALGRGTLMISGGATVSDVDSFISSIVGQTAEATVAGTGSTWRNTGDLSMGGNGGSAVLNITSGGQVVVAGQVEIGSPATVNIGIGGAPGVLNGGSIANNGSLNFNHTGVTTFSVPLSGGGTVFKNGTGSSTITSAAGYTGRFEANAGELILRNTLSASEFRGNGGVLRFDAATVNPSGTAAIRANAGGAIEYKNSTVNGGFLRGPGTHTVVAGSNNTFNGVTTFNNTVIAQSGAATFNNFTNGGAIASAGPLTLDGARNVSSGAITINNELFAEDFTNDGVFTVNTGGVVNVGSSNLVSGGGSRNTVNAGGVVFLSDNTAWQLNGAQLVNSGEINGAVDVYFGSLAKGSGNYGAVNVFDGGTFAPGNSAGSVSVADGGASFDKGSTFQIELGGLLPGQQHDRVLVAGPTQLGGTLEISFINGFVPSIGNAFEILRYGSRAGNFDDITGDYFGGGLFLDTVFDADSLTLVMTQAGPGDTDLDGDVDLADLGNLATSFGTGSGLIDWINGDFDGDNDVDLNDLGTLATNFDAGRAQAYAAFGELVSVPEPSTGVLAALFTGASWRRRRAPRTFIHAVPITRELRFGSGV